MTNPPWAALAADAIRRLQRLGGEKATKPDIRTGTDPLAWLDEPWAGKSVSLARTLAALPSAMPLPFDEQREIATAGGDPGAVARKTGAERTPARLPVDQLLLVLRLCATCGSVAAMEAMTRPRAITVLEHGEVPEEVIREVLDQALLPRGVRCSIGWEHRDADPAALCVLVLKPGTADGWNRFRLDRDLARLLALDAPVLILVPDRGDLPDHWRHVLPAPVTLTPLDREILLALLRVTHAGAVDIDTEALRDRFPEDTALAALSLPAILIALRESTPFEVAERLGTMLPPQEPGPVVAEGPTLDDIEGYGGAEAAARRMVADLQAWARDEVAWSEVQRSLLLYGEPGAGKTFLATAMANSAGIAMVRGGFAQWQAAGHLGHMLAAMRRSFAEARAAAPAILVIDEIDSVGSRVSRDSHGEAYRRQVINGFLEELDGLRTMEGVLVVGTCNHPGAIDAAVLRPGRFDIKVEVPRPGRAAVARMLRGGYPGVLVTEDLARLARAAAGHTAAAIDAALRGARAAARAERRPVGVEDVLAACGPRHDQHQAVGYRTAIHECGHAIVAAALGVSEVRRIVLTPSGGETWTEPKPREGLLFEFEADLARSMAGRAAERLVLGEVSAGAGGPATSDIAQATALAMQIDLQFGLGAEGPLWCGPEPRYLAAPENAARVRTRLAQAEERAIRILSRNRALLERMADALLQAGILEGEELGSWLRRVAGER